MFGMRNLWVADDYSTDWSDIILNTLFLKCKRIGLELKK
jgi:hypothetical protein